MNIEEIMILQVFDQSLRNERLSESPFFETPYISGNSIFGVFMSSGILDFTSFCNETHILKLGHDEQHSSPHNTSFILCNTSFEKVSFCDDTKGHICTSILCTHLVRKLMQNDEI